MPLRAIFFDRDGVLNVNKVNEQGHSIMSSYDQWEWMPGAVATINRCKRQNLVVCIITNQRGIGHGRYTQKQFHDLMNRAADDVARHWDATYFCPHLKPCKCRKPAPGMLIQAMADFDLRPEECVMIGDQLTDVEAATNAGMKGYLYDGGDLEVFLVKNGIL